MERIALLIVAVCSTAQVTPAPLTFGLPSGTMFSGAEKFPAVRSGGT
jgi:hypothetical protein